MGRIDALIQRWGLVAVMAMGGALTLVGLGSTGLWEPWEMDRADLARTLADPPEVAVALAADAGALDAQLQAAASEVGVVLRTSRSHMDVARGGRRPATRTDRALQGALDRGRTRVIAALVLDVGLLLPEPDKAESWRAAAAKVNEARRYVPNGAVILVEHAGALTVDELQTRLAVERASHQWRELAPAYGLDKLVSPEQAQTALAARAAAAPPDPGLIILGKPDHDALADALVHAAAGHAAIARFKEGGQTLAVPPLEAWLRSASFRMLGPSELSARLPGALMGLITLWVLFIVLRTVWGHRVAFFSGLVLITTPLFLAQARSVAGEPAAILALTLVAAGLLLRMRHAPARLVWSYLATGFMIGFFAMGLFGSLLALGLAAAVPLIALDRQLSRWAPALIFGGVTAALALWVLSSPADGFAGQFRMTLQLFSDGPTGHSRNFDWMLRELGFGLVPWSPLVVVALGAAALYAVTRKDRAVLVVVCWFALPLLANMAALKSFHHFVFIGAAAAAVLVGLLLDHLIRHGVRSFFIALAMVAMTYVLFRELGQSPEPLVSFLTIDPPFADKGQQAFPEAVRLHAALRLALLAGGVLMMVYFGRLISFGRSALITFRRERPFAIALGAALMLAPIWWLIRVGNFHRVAAGRAHLAEMGEGQRTFLREFASPLEPVVLVAILVVVTLVSTAVVLYALPRLGARLRSVFRAISPPPRTMLWVAAAVMAGTAVVMISEVAFPNDYWGETLFGPPTLVAYAAVAALGFAVWRLEGTDWSEVAAVVLMALSLLVIMRLDRDTTFPPAMVLPAIGVGWLAATWVYLPRLTASPERFAIGAGALIALCLAAIAIPLLDRAGWVEDVLYPGTRGYLVKRTLVASVGAWLCYLGVAALLINRRFHDELAGLARRVLILERPRVVAAAALGVGLVVTVGMTFGFSAALAENVSQKHVLDAFLSAEAGQGDDDSDPRDRMFKHGNFGSQDRKDANFYTAGLAEIRDRSAALEVLRGARDQVVQVDGPRGIQTRVLPGWSAINDGNRDGRRDESVIRGFATAVEPQTLTDSSQSFPPGGLVGRTLVSPSGAAWEITGNDAHTVTVSSASRLTFQTSPPDRAAYVIDAASAGDHRATAPSRERRALLIPNASLSDINHAFRRLSGGRHLPILDGRSYRVLLATSWLEDGEPQQNRLALATYDQARFDGLGGAVHRVSGTFDGAIEVVGYSVASPVVSKGERVELTVYYKALKAIPKSYKIFIHLDLQGGGSERIPGDHWPLNPTRHSDKNKHCTGCYRTDHWMPGDIVADTYGVDIDGSVGTGDYRIWVGFFLPGPDSRMKVTGFDRETTQHGGDNRLGLGLIKVR